MVFNDLQIELLGLLEAGIDKFTNQKYFSIAAFKACPSPGVYVYGNVGSGKTTAMRHFFEGAKLNKLFIQYQKLIKTIHQNSLHLNDLAITYFKGINLLFIDEIEIKDPADAVIIYNLLRKLQQMKIFVVLSSNFHPKDFQENIVNKDLLPIFNIKKKQQYLSH
jgi:cell division protein ZapE